MTSSNKTKNLTVQVLQRIGSPAGVPPALSQDSPYLRNLIEQEFEWAWENRIGLLYLLSIPENLLTDELIERRFELSDREAKTFEVIQRVSNHLNNTNIGYIIFKTFRPFPFTPNDTDILVLGSEKDYEYAHSYLQEQGYGQLGVAPLQTLMYDPAGEGIVGLKKEGGIYYIDLYRQAGADFIQYLDPIKASSEIQYTQIENIKIPKLKPELELPVMLFHNVFPENTYHIEHFYLTLYYLYGKNKFDLIEFLHQTKNNHYLSAVKANLTATAILHEKAFGFSPDKINLLINQLGGSDRKTANRLIKAGFKTPYYFHSLLFIGVVIAKMAEWNTLKSILIQAVHMLNPVFLFDTIRAFIKRVRGAGVYEQV